MTKLRILDLFSGIGGFSLGLERTGGFETVAFCEIEPFPRKVLAKHWPKVPIYNDVRELTAERLRADGIGVDVICGGFPCQDISTAGKGAGIEGERSGLWSEYARLIGELRPRYVLVENVAALLGRGLDRVLGDLSEIGFDAEWHCIPASAVGARHRRDRVWIVAHPSSERVQQFPRGQYLSNGEWIGSEAQRRRNNKPVGVAAVRHDGSVADATSELSNGSDHHRRGHSEYTQPLSQSGDGSGSENMADTSQQDVEGQWFASRIQAQRSASGSAGWWSTEPDVGRVAHGVPQKLDGDLDANEMGGEKASATTDTSIGGMSGLWSDGRPAKTPSRLYFTDALRGALSAMSHQGGSSRRYPEGEGDEELQGVREGVHSQPQQEPQHLQQGVPFRDWPHQRDEALGIWSQEPDIPRVASGVKGRVDRLKGLGNAVVPQVVELLGRAILDD